MCLQTVIFSKDKRFKKPIGKYVTRFKLFSGYPHDFSSCLFGNIKYSRNRPYSARAPQVLPEKKPLQVYRAGFHAFKHRTDAERYAKHFDYRLGHGHFICKVQVRGLLAKGKQYGMPVEVYQYMKIPKEDA